jgi:UDP:flavonoid glycosyltransferase YjiC (YdhE family)
VVDDPAAFTSLVYEAIKLSGVRAIISKGWGGFGGENPPEGVLLLGNCPHDWLFPRMSCVVHHGGAGTTAIGIALGKPTVVVPFFGDQEFWGAMIYRGGAGPKPIAYKDLTAEDLAESIEFALKPETCEAASKMAAQIQNEDGKVEGARQFHEALNIDAMRCDLCPDRLAVWRHKPSGKKLSALAVTVLARDSHLLLKDCILLVLSRPLQVSLHIG